jgi:hypothetical protein
MLYREIIAVCSEILTKHINTAVWAERSQVATQHSGAGAAVDCISLSLSMIRKATVFWPSTPSSLVGIK